MLTDKEIKERKLPKVGHVLIDFRDQLHLVKGYSAGRGASTGRVHTDLGDYYPSVFGLPAIQEDLCSK